MSVEPREVVAKVESYVHRELHDAQTYENREPLDESGIFSLHLMAADIYALGIRDGELTERMRNDAERQRGRE